MFSLKEVFCLMKKFFGLFVFLLLVMLLACSCACAIPKVNVAVPDLYLDSMRNPAFLAGCNGGFVRMDYEMGALPWTFNQDSNDYYNTDDTLSWHSESEVSLDQALTNIHIFGAYPVTDQIVAGLDLQMPSFSTTFNI